MAKFFSHRSPNPKFSSYVDLPSSPYHTMLGTLGEVVGPTQALYTPGGQRIWVASEALKPVQALSEGWEAAEGRYHPGDTVHTRWGPAEVLQGPVQTPMGLVYRLKGQDGHEFDDWEHEFVHNAPMTVANKRAARRRISSTLGKQRLAKLIALAASGSKIVDPMNIEIEEPEWQIVTPVEVPQPPVPAKEPAEQPQEEPAEEPSAPDAPPEEWPEEAPEDPQENPEKVEEEEEEEELVPAGWGPKKRKSSVPHEWALKVAGVQNPKNTTPNYYMDSDFTYRALNVVPDGDSLKLVSGGSGGHSMEWPKRQPAVAGCAKGGQTHEPVKGQPNVKDAVDQAVLAFRSNFFKKGDKIKWGGPGKNHDGIFDRLVPGATGLQDARVLVISDGIKIPIKLFSLKPADPKDTEEFDKQWVSAVEQAKKEFRDSNSGHLDPTETSPWPGCTCGIYSVGVNQLDMMRSYVKDPFVIVKLKTWGSTMKGIGDAQTSQFAMPWEIYVPEDCTYFGKFSSEQVAKILQDEYGAKGIVVDPPMNMSPAEYPKDMAKGVKYNFDNVDEAYKYLLDIGAIKQTEDGNYQYVDAEFGWPKAEDDEVAKKNDAIAILAREAGAQLEDKFFQSMKGMSRSYEWNGRGMGGQMIVALADGKPISAISLRTYQGQVQPRPRAYEGDKEQTSLFMQSLSDIDQRDMDWTQQFFDSAEDVESFDEYAIISDHTASEHEIDEWLEDQGHIFHHSYHGVDIDGESVSTESGEIDFIASEEDGRLLAAIVREIDGNGITTENVLGVWGDGVAISAYVEYQNRYGSALAWSHDVEKGKEPNHPYIESEDYLDGEHHAIHDLDDLSRFNPDYVSWESQYVDDYNPKTETMDEADEYGIHYWGTVIEQYMPDTIDFSSDTWVEIATELMEHYIEDPESFQYDYADDLEKLTELPEEMAKQYDMGFYHDEWTNGLDQADLVPQVIKAAQAIKPPSEWENTQNPAMSPQEPIGPQHYQKGDRIRTYVDGVPVEGTLEGMGTQSGWVVMDNGQKINVRPGLNVQNLTRPLPTLQQMPQQQVMFNSDPYWQKDKAPSREANEFIEMLKQSIAQAKQKYGLKFRWSDQQRLTSVGWKFADLNPDDTITFIVAADFNPNLGDELRNEVRMGHWTPERLREIAERSAQNGVLTFNDGTGNSLRLDAVDWDQVGMHYEEEERLEEDEPMTIPQGVPVNWTPRSNPFAPDPDRPYDPDEFRAQMEQHAYNQNRQRMFEQTGITPDQRHNELAVEQEHLPVKGSRIIVTAPSGHEFEATMVGSSHEPYTGLKGSTRVWFIDEDGDTRDVLLGRYQIRPATSLPAPEWTDTPQQAEHLVRNASENPDYSFVYYMGELNLVEWSHTNRHKRLLKDLLNGVNMDTADDFDDNKVAGGTVTNGKVEFEGAIEPEVRREAEKAIAEELGSKTNGDDESPSNEVEVSAPEGITVNVTINGWKDA